MKTIVNKPPRSKTIEIIKDDKDKQFLKKQSIKGKWHFFVVSHKRDRISRQMSKLNTIAEQIALQNKLFDSSSVESYLINETRITTSANNRGLNRKCLKKVK
jgi:hypothetical protein